jgi:hypothetical protein
MATTKDTWKRNDNNKGRKCWVNATGHVIEQHREYDPRPGSQKTPSVWGRVL